MHLIYSFLFYLCLLPYLFLVFVWSPRFGFGFGFGLLQGSIDVGACTAIMYDIPMFFFLSVHFFPILLPAPSLCFPNQLSFYFFGKK